MTFSTEIEKRRTTRATLARINPGRFISLSLVSEGSGVYAVTMAGFDVSALKRNGTALTLVTLSSPSVNDTYSFNETTGRLAVKLASAPDATANILVVYYYLFYTSGDKTDYYRTPDVASGSKVYWAPYILGASSFNSSIDGLEAGIVSIPDASIDISNTDNEFADYLTDDDSFFNKTIDIWQEINGQFRKAFSGRITSIPTVSDSVVSVSFSDQLSLLNATAFMGDSFGECYHASSAIPKKDLFKPIPLHMALQTYHIAPSTDGGGFGVQTVPTEGLQAVCTSYSDTISYTTNRTWTLCRALGTINYQSYNAITATASPGVSQVFFNLSGANGFFVGETMEWEEGGIDYRGIILGKDVDYLGTTYDYVVNPIGEIGIYMSTSSVIYSLPSVCVFLKLPGGFLRYGIYNRDYQLTAVPTTGGNETLVIEFFDNFEDNMFVEEPLDPNTFEVQYKVSTGNIKHYDGLKTILEKAGCSVNYASFFATGYNTDLCMSIPFKNETEYSPYIVYVQKILESMLSFLYQGADNTLYYRMIELPTGTSTRTSDHFLEGSFSSSVEYRDIYTEIIPKNQHNAIVGNVVLDGSSESLKSRYLNDYQRAFNLQHVLEHEADGTISRQAEILAIKSNRQSVITYRTETIDLETIVGDEQTIESDVVSGSRDIFVTSVQKSETETTVSGTDLLGL